MSTIRPGTQTSVETTPHLYPKQKGNKIAEGAQEGDGQQIASGAVKTIYQWIMRDELGVLKLNSDRVLYVAPTFLGNRELVGEVEKAKDIETALIKKGSDSSESHIQTDLQLRSDGLGVDAPAAIGDLEGCIKNPDLSLETRLDLAFQVIIGMHNMQKAGYVTGDAKLENILVFEEEGRLVARISDFGKARKLDQGEVSLVDGNPRFTSPEGILTQEGEVFSTALMVLRILEEGLNPGACEKLKVSINGVERRGVEGLLIREGRSNKKGVSGQLAFAGKYAAAKTTGKVSLDRAHREETAIHSHIDSLSSEHFFGRDTDKPMDSALLGIFGLLKDMTQANPKDRPSMEEVEKRFKQAMDKSTVKKPVLEKSTKKHVVSPSLSFATAQESSKGKIITEYF